MVTEQKVDGTKELSIVSNPDLNTRRSIAYFDSTLLKRSIDESKISSTIVTVSISLSCYIRIIYIYIYIGIGGCGQRSFRI